MEARLAPAITALGAGPGGAPLVTVLDDSGAVVTSFNAYDAGFSGGVNVAVADVTGDRVPDVITGAGPGGGPQVKVFDGVTFAEVRSFFAYDAAFTGGVNVAAADVDAHDTGDIVTGAGPGGGPQVKLFDGRTLAVLQSFFAYDPAFTGGVTVAVGDLNGDFLPDVITGAGAGGGPNVKAFDGRTGAEVANFFAYDPGFTGGVNVASGDVDANSAVDLITGPGPGGGPDVRAWKGGKGGASPTLLSQFLAFDAANTGGVRVGSVPGALATADRIAVTSQSSAGPLKEFDLAGNLLVSSALAAGGAGGFSISSDASPPPALGGGGGDLPPAKEQMPADNQQPLLSNVVYYPAPNGQNAGLFNKTITITNVSTTEKIFPFIEGPNDGNFVKNDPTTAYDNQDTQNRDYRAYLGYFDQASNNYYFGVLPGKSITVSVPLVFWDSARIHFAKDAEFFTTTQTSPGNGVNNPWNYFATWNDAGTIRPTLRKIDKDTASGTNAPATGGFPVVLYYKDPSPKPVGPANEAPDQLLELTIRDPYQRTLNPNLPADILGPLVDYDVSFVDSLAFPGTLEAPNVLIPDKSAIQPFAYIGADQTIGEFQAAVQDFTSSDPSKNGLGKYFGGQGWNFFYNPNPASTGIKIPATKNVFNLSPLNLGISQYRTGDNNTVLHHILASGGVWYQVDTGSSGTFLRGDTTIQGVDASFIATLAKAMLTNNPDYFTPGTTITDLGANSITLSSGALRDRLPLQAPTFVGSQFTGAGTVAGANLTLANPSLLTSLKPGMLVQIGSSGQFTTIARIANSFDPSKQTTVPLDRTPSPISQQTTFTFSGAIGDYVAERLLDLWYAWADYYVAYVTSLNPFGGDPTSAPFPGGTVAAGANSLTLPGDLSKLKPGMTVTGPANALYPNTVISSISGNMITLSQFAFQGAANASFTFGLPVPIPRAGYVPSAAANPLKLAFSPDAAAKANQYATTEYSVMQAFSQIPQVHTTVTGSSVGQSVTSPTINVATTDGFAASGQLQIQVSSGAYVTVTYTGKTPTSFTGCSTAGTGTLLATSTVTPFPVNANFNSLAFLQNIIGGNVPLIPNIGGDKTALGVLYTNQSKSLERGVYDFTDKNIDESQWYPNPGDSTPGATTGGKPAEFNVYVLDPYAWFVHVTLGVSGYAFSLDDDAANVQAPLPTPQANFKTALNVVVGGITTPAPDVGQPNKYQWSSGAQFGPKSSQGTAVAGSPDKITGLDHNMLVNYLVNPDATTPGALVLGPGVQPGTRISFIDLSNNFVQLSNPRGPALVNPPAGPQTYSFFGAVHATGTISPSTAGDRITGLNPDVVKALNDISANSSLLPGALTVIGPGVASATSGATTGTGPAGQFPTGVVVGDFNGDAKLDAATANYGPTGGNSVSVLFGTGGGAFSGPTTTLALPAGTNPFGITTGKFIDGSNNLSIVTGNFAGQSAAVLLGNGDGTFKAPLLLPAKDSADGLHKIVAVAAGDLNGDNHQDIVAASGDGTYTVFLGNGDGTFNPLPSRSALTPIFGIAIADFNVGAGLKPGLVVGAFAANRVGVLAGNGDGTFAAPIFTLVGSAAPVAITPQFIATGDFNKDGKMDVATANKSDGTASALLGNGDGTFSPATTYAVGAVPLGITVADFNKDGNPDFAVANLGSNSVSVLLGNGNGSFAPAQAFGPAEAPLGLSAGDFNPSAGALDLVFTNFVGRQHDKVTLELYTTGPTVTRVKSVGSDFVILDTPLDTNQKAGTYRFKFS